MGDFNCSTLEGQIRKRHVLDDRKYCNFENCNSADNRRSKGKDCKAEENKYIVLCEKKIILKFRMGKLDLIQEENILLIINRK
jgi:hypothetical protein